MVTAAVAGCGHSERSSNSLSSGGGKGKIATAQKTFTFSAADENAPQRLEVRCPKGNRPLGGGLTSDGAIGSNGIGVYPTSSERLGVQEGWHITATLFNDSHESADPHTATLQAFCTKLKGDLKPVQATILVNPGESGTVTATCPRGRKVMSGGYLSTQFFPGKGIYATESRRISDTTWEATAFGVGTGKGGSLTALAYCVGSSKSVLSEQTATATVAQDGTATATTPPCPGNAPLSGGGFSGPPGSGNLRFFNPTGSNNSWSTSAIGVLGGGDFTAYGYCLLTTKISKNGKGSSKPEITTVPITVSSFNEPPSPHGNSFTLKVTGTSSGKLRGNPSTATPVTECLKGRPTLITTSFKTPTKAGPAGPPVNTTSDNSGNYSADVPISLPAGLDTPVQLTVTASFNTNVNKKVGGKRVTCQPGGPVRPQVITLTGD